MLGVQKIGFFQNSFRVFAIIGLALQAVGCGSSSESQPKSEEANSENPGDFLQSKESENLSLIANEPAQFLVAAMAEKYSCPSGFDYNATLKMCSNGTDSSGPFTNRMIENCKAAGGGNACNNPALNNNLASRLRGNNTCPIGAVLTSTKLCAEGEFAYGPFTEAHVASCKEKGGGTTCDTLKWNLNFAQWALPKETTPVAQDKFTFPFTGAARYDYVTPPRSFSAQRSGGRLHAGADLYAPVGHPIYAVGDGVVTDFYEFYDSTYAIVVDHGSFVVRYGETKYQLPRGISIGAKVKRGQHIASVGLLQSLQMSMLHFERYSKTRTGQLTVRNNWPYQRRNDLVNPTRELQIWKYPR